MRGELVESSVSPIVTLTFTLSPMGRHRGFCEEKGYST